MHTLMKALFLVTILAAATGCAAPPGSAPTDIPSEPAVEPTEEGPWRLIWSDEFDGEVLNPDNWTYDLGGNGWGNNEWQDYTDRPENVRVAEGFLVIEAREEKSGGRSYTSGRIKTQGLHDFKYGRFEARMKLPRGQGLWSAFWLLGSNLSTVPWPGNGEIDIMENIGQIENQILGTLHGPGYFGGGSVRGPFNLPETESFAEDFHVFAVEWEPAEIRWFVDEDNYLTLTPADVPGDWVYDHPFFIILNVAVGGNHPKYPDETTVFPQQMLVDYVRVYESTEPLVEVNNGEVYVGDLRMEVEETDTGWRANAWVTALNADGSPVPGARVSVGWLGIVNVGDTQLVTNEAGVAGPFSTIETQFNGEITLCVTEINSFGYTYQKGDNVKTCVSVEN
jgi:beta-glucanase (GH16 family)